MKKLSKIFIVLAMILSVTSISMFDVSAETTTDNVTGTLTLGNETATGAGWTWDEVNYILTINEDLTVSGTNSSGHAIEFDINETSTVTIVLNANLTVISNEAGIFSGGGLLITGSGDLCVSSDKYFAINCAADVNIDIGGNLTISAADTGIVARSLNILVDGNLEITAMAGISTTNASITVGGDLYIKTLAGSAISCDEDINIDIGGNLTIITTDGGDRDRWR